MYYGRCGALRSAWLLVLGSGTLWGWKILCKLRPATPCAVLLPALHTRAAYLAPALLPSPHPPQPAPDIDSGRHIQLSCLDLLTPDTFFATHPPIFLTPILASAAMNSEAPATETAASTPTVAPVPAPVAAPGTSAATDPGSGAATSDATPDATPASRPGGRTPAPALAPVMAELARRYPALFGDTPLPLKRGIYQDLLEAHPDIFAPDTLRAALDWHTRSNRYLQALTSGTARHDLGLQAVEPVAPEHVLHALLWLHRRRKPRAGETEQDLRDKTCRRIAHAFVRSGLSRAAYLDRTQVRDPQLLALVHAALDEVAAQDARAEALHRAWQASGAGSVPGFAAMYGMDVRNVQRQLHRARQLQAQSLPPAQ